MKKMLYVCAGIVAVAFGAVGTVLPGLPTTPFLLLALFCFTKGSEKLNRWFRGTKLYHEHLEQYEHDRSLTRKQKITIQIFSGIMMSISFVLTDSLVIRLLLAGAFLIHNYIFIFVIKTRKTSRQKNPRPFPDEEAYVRRQHEL